MPAAPTLTIEPGVTVDLVSYQIQVNGALNARGTSDTKISIISDQSTARIEFASNSVPWNEQTGVGCIIDNAFISSVPLVVSGGSPYIVNNAILFGSSTDGIHVTSGSPMISSNYIAGQGGFCGIYTEGTASIIGNKIISCWSGINAVGQTNIQQNIIMSNVNDGVVSRNSGSTIKNNAIVDNQCGISGTGNIQANTIGNNVVGIWGPSPTATIANNNIYGNYNVTSGVTQNIHLTDSNNLSVPNNWWGTTDQSTIAQTLWDVKNDSVHLGNIYFCSFSNWTEP